MDGIKKEISGREKREEERGKKTEERGTWKVKQGKRKGLNENEEMDGQIETEHKRSRRKERGTKMKF